MKKQLIYSITFVTTFLHFSCSNAQELPNTSPNHNEWELVWSDEFNTDGQLDSTVWNYEVGFQRNHEDQWYQPENAYCKDGCLIIEARKEKKKTKEPKL